MVFPIGPVRPPTHEIEYSCDFNGSNKYMTRRPSTAGSERIGTYRFLVKRGRLGGPQQLVHVLRTSNARHTAMLVGFDSSNRLRAVGTGFGRATARTFTSTTDWHDICVQIDGNQTDDSCCTIEVDGEQITSFSTKTNPSNPANFNLFNTARNMGIGRNTASTDWFDGLISGDSLIVDGTNYDASNFGEFVNGVWRPKKVEGINFGTNGFMFDFADSSNLGNDVSGNNNDFTTHNMDASNQRSDTPTS